MPSLWDVFFFFLHIHNSSPTLLTIPCLTSNQHLSPHVNTNYKPKMDQTDVPAILCDGKTRCIQTRTWVPMVPTRATHLPPTSGVAVSNLPHRASLLCLSPLSLLSLSLRLKNQENRHRQWKSDELYLKGIGLVYTRLIFDLFSLATLSLTPL